MFRSRMVWLLLVLAQGAQAQLSVPSVRLPALPGVGLPVNVDKSVASVTGDLDPARLTDLHRLRVLDLIRRNPKALEADPNGAAIVRGEVLAFSPSSAALEKARIAGFLVLRERVLDGLDSRIVVLGAPEGLGTRRALKRLREADPAGIYDFNHLYLGAGVAGTGAAEAATPDVGANTPGAGGNTAGAGTSARAAANLRLGLIDGGVDTSHPVFRDMVIHQYGCSGKPVPAAHGTEVASLMIGRDDRFHGAAPGSELFAADVYCGLPAGGAVDAVADAFAWLAREKVPVINVSLVGPANAMLENVVRAVVSRGHIVVAAVGNDGPAAPPLYPAAYPGVVGVTGVDARRRVLIEAGRGPHVKFAAPGADMSAAEFPTGYVMVRGTSFAAPIVAGLLAVAIRETDRAVAERAVADRAAAAERAFPDRDVAQRAIADLARQAVDLGAPGPDPVYGAGLVGAELRPEPALASTRARAQ
jgi:subtilisin family serine protease